MSDTYTPEEFAKSCVLRGYCRKQEALDWLEAKHMSSAGEDDFIRCYYDLNAEMIVPHRSPYRAMSRTGYNFVAPENVTSRKEQTFEQAMRLEQHRIDNMGAYRRRREDNIHDGSNST